MREVNLVASTTVVPTTVTPTTTAAPFLVWSPWIQWMEIGMLVFVLFLLYAVYTQPDWLLAILSKRFPFAIWYGNTKLPVVALTIDDAPSNNTAAILDVLKENNVKATFFIIHGNIAGREHIIKRIVDEGHSMGNHFVRDEASIKDPLDVFESKLLHCHETLVSYQGRVRWARPGSGWFNKGMEQVAEKHGYRFAMGSVYPHDAQIRISKVNEWHLRWLTRPGSVLIVHDRPWSVAVLKGALEPLSKKFKFITLDEMEEIHANGNYPVVKLRDDVEVPQSDAELQGLLEKKEH
ncbi:hypothetical protein Ae201684P_002309 [Aphanomyces euteiches]|nr:hypothetical protein Ae201684P_002309 [Aphanomyces euteiches]